MKYLGRSSDEIISNSEIEKELKKSVRHDTLGRKVIIRNQVLHSPIYQGLDYFFLNGPQWKHQWIVIPLMAVIKTFKEAGIDFKKPPMKEPRKNWSFNHFIREVFHCKPGTLIFQCSNI